MGCVAKLVNASTGIFQGASKGVHPMENDVRCVNEISVVDSTKFYKVLYNATAMEYRESCTVHCNRLK